MKIDQVKTLLRKLEDEIPVIRPGINTFYRPASTGGTSGEADWVIQIDMDVLAVDHIRARAPTIITVISSTSKYNQ